jgi:pimeloyl-ACP methyl ester carboxylesterase
LVKTGNWLNHLEYDWESPIWRHFFVGLSREHRLIRYDPRGTGLSDWDVADISLDAWVNDVAAVVDAAAVERFPLLGYSQGCAVSIAYAVRHPERVSHLILCGGFAHGAQAFRRRPREAASDDHIDAARMGRGQSRSSPDVRRQDDAGCDQGAGGIVQRDAAKNNFG